jgi:hypothetical protein
MRALARTVVALALGGSLPVAACSPSQDHPPDLGDCTSTDGSACANPVTGTGSGGSEAGTSACAVDAGGGQCAQCLSASCCTPIAACEANTSCANLVSCEDGCNSAAACVSACQTQYPAGISPLQAITDCETLRCPICAQSGVGDPCSPGYGPCVAGLTCNGLWCTRACARSSDCAGIGNGGASVLGFPNVCTSTASGDGCVPECSSTVDCADFPATFCKATTTLEGSAVSVCAALPDASTD